MEDCVADIDDLLSVISIYILPCEMVRKEDECMIATILEPTVKEHDGFIIHFDKFPVVTDKDFWIDDAPYWYYFENPLVLTLWSKDGNTDST